MNILTDVHAESGAVVIFSGGQDSSTCLAWAKQTFPRVLALSFDYGQRHRVELLQAEKIAKQWQVEWRILPISTATKTGTSSLTDLAIEVPNTLTAEVPNTFVPGRNLLFLSYAGILAFQEELNNLIIGANQVDYSGYPDCRADFLASAEQGLRLALDRPQLTVHAPLLNLDKAAVWRWSAQLGVLDDIIEFSHTCYNGDREHRHTWGYGCGHCPACLLRAQGYAAAFNH